MAFFVVSIKIICLIKMAKLRLWEKWKKKNWLIISNILIFMKH
jgi:hypothetical protein